MEAVEALLDVGADVGARSPSGQTARDIAQAEGKTQVVEVLARRLS